MQWFEVKSGSTLTPQTNIPKETGFVILQEVSCEKFFPVNINKTTRMIFIRCSNLILFVCKFTA